MLSEQLQNLAADLSLASAWFMAGVIWFVQMVHYPLMAVTAASAFPRYEEAHLLRTRRVVMPAMLLELASAAALLLSPDVIDQVAAIALFAALIVVWISTFAIQVPSHRSLSQGFNAHVHRRLVRSNWIRTIAWSARAIGLTFLLS